MRGRRVLVVGDVMLDEWVWGSVSRISPEAPVPVVAVATIRLRSAARATSPTTCARSARRSVSPAPSATIAEGERVRALLDGIARRPLRAS